MASNTRHYSPALRVLSALGGWIRHVFVLPSPTTPEAVKAFPRAYDLRKQKLPKAFSARDWDSALQYWGYACAICERPRGLWHTLAQDHWIPLTDPHCPGTVSVNILPLCHGEDGCNNSKGKKQPEIWLEAKLGKRRANKKLKEIAAYFAWVSQQQALSTPVEYCPGCAEGILHWVEAEEGFWRCESCSAEWVDDV